MDSHEETSSISIELLSNKLWDFIDSGLTLWLIFIGLRIINERRFNEFAAYEPDLRFECVVEVNVDEWEWEWEWELFELWWFVCSNFEIDEDTDGDRGIVEDKLGLYLESRRDDDERCGEEVVDVEVDGDAFKSERLNLFFNSLLRKELRNLDVVDDEEVEVFLSLKSGML